MQSYFTCKARLLLAGLLLAQSSEFKCNKREVDFSNIIGEPDARDHGGIYLEYSQNEIFHTVHIDPGSLGQAVGLEILLEEMVRLSAAFLPFLRVKFSQVVS